MELEVSSLTDDALVDLMCDPRVSKISIDAPFGWPLAFIDAITSYRDEGRWIDLEANELRFRATETAIAAETGQIRSALRSVIWPGQPCAALDCCPASLRPTLCSTEAVPAAS